MFSDLIFSSLRDSPLLLDKSVRAQCFDRSSLSARLPEESLSFDQKLGHLYEDGLACLLRLSERYDLLERGLQIQSDRHNTLGELDFLLRDLRADRLIHLELAVKFYLAIDSEEGLLLPGPDARDNYYRKYEHLQNHQLTLAMRHRNHLPAQYQETLITPQHLVIGCLFDHISAGAPARPLGVQATARRGRWLRQCELFSYFPSDSCIRTIPKPLWPVPLAHLGVEHTTSLSLQTPLTRCVMVMVNEELDPIFIAPDSYPEMEYER